MLRGKKYARLLAVLTALAGLTVFGIRAVVSRVPAPANLGVVDGKLAPCPDTPNCVSTQSSDAVHGIEPLRVDGPVSMTRQRLLDIVESMDRTRIVSATPAYIHAEFQTPVFGFVDDVEFFLDEAQQVVHVRSASRVGRGDLGVNRARMESIRAALERPGGGQ